MPKSSPSHNLITDGVMNSRDSNLNNECFWLWRMEFFGIGIKVYSLLDLVKEFESCFGGKYKVRRGLTFMNVWVAKHIFLLNNVAITKQIEKHPLNNVWELFYVLLKLVFKTTPLKLKYNISSLSFMDADSWNDPLKLCQSIPFWWS